MAALFGHSSCDYLEPQELSLIEEDDVYKNLTYIQQMWINTYSYLPGKYSAIYWSGSDESEAVDDQSEIHKYNLGNWNKYSNPDDKWSHYYTGIRQCCEIMETLPDLSWDLYKDSDPLEYQYRMALMKEYVTEARFLKAFYYFELVKRYGGVPLVNNRLYLDKESDLYFLSHVSRDTFKKCIDYIVSECDSVAPDLPLSYESAWHGRATRGAALALKSRALLYAASDLYNQPGNTNEYIGYTDGDRAERWLAAAEAAGDVINMSYSLHTSYQNLFIINAGAESSEMIWERRASNTNDIEKENYPIGYELGRTGTCPSQNLVDAYEMADGTLFDWSKPDMAETPYGKRDLRLTLTILTNNELWCGRAIEAWEGGLDGKPRRHASKTGYYLKKHLNNNFDLNIGNSSSRQWILFRYAEILLNYAEAAAHCGGPDYKVAGGKYTAKEAIDLIRTRVVMPKTDATFAKRGVSLDNESFLALVYNERRVELAFEGHRWWDARRWMIGDEVFGATIKGVKVEKLGANKYIYTPMVVEKRTFDASKMYFYPVPQSEIAKSNGNMIQNPNW